MIAKLLPAKVRAIIYGILGVLSALEIVWDVVPSQLEGKLTASAVALGFGLALSKTAD